MPAEVPDEIRCEMTGLLVGWEHLWNADRLADRLTVEVSSRLRSSVGRCYPERRLIRLAVCLIDGSRELLPEVLCHEAAHVVVYERFGRSVRPHGREWRRLVETAGFPARTRVPIEGPVNRRNLRRWWRHTCPVCGASRTAGRPMRRWRCVACVDAGRGGELVITRLVHREEPQVESVWRPSEHLSGSNP